MAKSPLTITVNIKGLKRMRKQFEKMKSQMIFLSIRNILKLAKKHLELNTYQDLKVILDILRCKLRKEVKDEKATKHIVTPHTY